MKKTSIVISVLLIFAALISTGCCNTETESKPAKYIFLFIGDGMGLDHITVTESYLSYKQDTLAGARLTFTQFPNMALCYTHSNNRMITCSAAAATAIACGAKTDNERIGTAPDGSKLKSIAYELQEKGYKIGIMTNNPVNHATPAGFYAHNDSRYGYYEISRELAESGFEFFGGSGFYQFKGRKGDLEPVGNYIEDMGYEVCYGPKEFEKRSAEAEKVVFIQETGREQDPEYYVSDGEEAEDVKIKEILDMSLEFLGDDEPFFIMCEGGNIDWAGHSNKTMAMVKEVIDFDDAVARAMEFYYEHPDETLIVVTADHETGGVSIGQGEEWRPEFVNWARLEQHWIDSGEKNILDKEENRELNEECLIGWTSFHHTGSPVPLYAIGKGAEKFKGMIDNIDIKGEILGE